MNWDRYFTEEMNSLYARLAVEAAKEQTLRESVRDVAFLYELRGWFVRNGGGDKTATAFAVRAIAELVGEGWLNVATWGTGGSVELIEPPVEELMGIVGELEKSGPAYFLVPTKKGREWVERFNRMRGELHAR